MQNALHTNPAFREDQGGKARNKPIRKKTKNDAWLAAAILSPMLLWWVVIFAFPIGFALVLGFFDWVGVGSKPKFAGFDNFIAFFKDSSYTSALWRSIWLGGLVTTLTIVSGLIAALFMNMPLFGRGIYRTLWYIPAVTSVIATTQVLSIFMNPVNGVFNNILKSMGFEPILWQHSVGWGIFWICVYSVWKGVGGTAIIWLAGLQSVDPTLYEAAETDGAGKWMKFRHVTLPGIKPIATYIVITGLIGAVQIYEQVAFITNGGPFGKTEVLVYKILRDGFFNFNMGMAGASSIILAIIVVSISVVYYKWSKED